MKRIGLTLFLLLVAASANGQQCAFRTGHDATLILAADVNTELQAGDLLIARHDTLCVGQAVYQQGHSLPVAIWGDNDLTPEVDGLPIGAPIEYSVHRPSTGVTLDEVVVTYLIGDGLYIPDGLYIVSGISFTGVLPVELVLFEGVADGRAVVLRWATASETNNAGFEIQVQRPLTDLQATPWQVLGYVEGHGTTLESQSYQYRAPGLAPGPHVFRLKQIDFDGTFDYSPEIEIYVELSEAYRLTPPYPNPFNHKTQLSLMVKRRQHLKVVVYDALGRRVGVLYRGEMEAEQARALVFEAGSLPSGLYVIRVEGETFSATRRVVLLN